MPRRPPPYQEACQRSSLSSHYEDKEQILPDDSHSRRGKRVSSFNSNSSEPLRITGLTYAFTSSKLPTTTLNSIPMDDKEEKDPILNGEDIYPSGKDRYKAPDIQFSNLDTINATDDERGAWGNKIEFILASVGLAVGLGNVWRFPYLCQQNGGGAFLIPYLIMMVIEGIPLFYIEFAVGQRFRRSAVGCYRKIHPALKGIGISCIVISGLLCIYYVAVIAWSFFYFFVSFTSKLPWSPDQCNGYKEFAELSAKCQMNSSDIESCTKKVNFAQCCVHDPQLYYFYRVALDISGSIEDQGNGVNGKLVGCLLLSWVVVCACIIKGVQSSGKVVYFTATFPYVILIILFFVGVTLDGADIGLVALFKPRWERLADAKIWMDAAGQMFFTLSLGFGALTSFASYMPIKNNCVRDAYTVVFINCGTSIFAGIVVFSILGHREHVTGLSVTEVGGGPGLAFITFCDAFLQIPVSPLWSILFFMMLILLGIDSEFGTLEGLITPFYDMKWIKMKKELFTVLIAAAMFFIGLALVSGPGYYAFQMFDDFAVSLPLLFIAFFQTISISWVYGNERFADDVEYMTGKRPFMFWMICWKYISPIAIFIIFVANCHKYVKETPSYKAYVGCSQQTVQFSSLSQGTATSTVKVPYPGWGQFIIFIFVTISMVPIIVYLVIDLYRHPKVWLNGFKKKFFTLVEYHPDPSIVDPSRRKTMKDIESDIAKDIENDALT